MKVRNSLVSLRLLSNQYSYLFGSDTVSKTIINILYEIYMHQRNHIVCVTYIMNIPQRRLNFLLKTYFYYAVTRQFIYKMGAVKFVDITGYERFNHYVDNLPQKGPKVCFFFSGKKDENGHSFCIFCQMGSTFLPYTT